MDNLETKILRKMAENWKYYQGIKDSEVSTEKEVALKEERLKELEIELNLLSSLVIRDREIIG